MSQFIVKFNTNNTTDIDSFVEFIKDNKQAILTVKTHTETLFYKFMTNDFADVMFDDNMRSCTLTYKDYNNNDLLQSTIKFDSSSTSAYTEFKKCFGEHLNSKYEVEYYPSGRELYIGEVLYKKDENGILLARIPNGSGTIYYDLPDHKIQYDGEFEEGLYDGAGIFYNNDGYKLKIT